MGQIKVEATAAVLGLRVGQQASFEDTPFLRAVIDGGRLRLVEDGDGDGGEGAEGGGEGAEARSRAKHPAGKRRAAATAAEGGDGG